MFIHPLETKSTPRPRIARILDPVEIRVLGSLMEKQLTTPEYYPLTLDALIAACNQKSNREPVMELTESEVSGALARLQDEKLIWRVMGGRAVRFDHNLDAVWHIEKSEKALLTLLFLRGAQTPGELRGRSDRLHPFKNVGEVEETLREMCDHSEPLVRQLPRRPGQKEDRWAHTLGGVALDELHPAAVAREAPGGEPLSMRVQRLEERIESLEHALGELKTKLGE